MRRGYVKRKGQRYRLWQFFFFFYWYRVRDGYLEYNKLIFDPKKGVGNCVFEKVLDKIKSVDCK